MLLKLTACYQSYGENCQIPCSQHCRNKNCSIFNGTCLYGCTEGFYGEKCNKGKNINHMRERESLSVCARSCVCVRVCVCKCVVLKFREYIFLV